mgnify:CR=1 FL=1
MEKNTCENLEHQIELNLEFIKDYQTKIYELQNENRKCEEKLMELKKSTTTFQLNSDQEKAVKNVSNNNIIIACPGSGKTHTLIAKIVTLVEQHKIDPNEIILITYTKKASQEMNNRLGTYLGFQKLQHTGTMHGLAYRVLQKFDQINYTILDEYDSHKNLKQSLSSHIAKLSMEEQSMMSKVIVSIYEKLSANYPMELKDLIIKMKLTFYHDIIKNGLNSYKKFKSDHNYLDFNDLMGKFLLFLKDDERSKEFKNNIKYILFDEYQDINSMQDTILRYMNIICENLTVVGDDAQSIYAFRGSDNKYILNFNKLYSNTNTYYLEYNYRSTKEIVKFCNDIIAHNNDKYDKKMIAVNDHGIKPKITGFASTDDEMKHIVDTIKMNNTILGVPYKSQVIITRKNRQLDCFELYLIKRQIPYVKTKGIGLLDRVHIKDFMAFLVTICNKKSIVHWKRILHILDGVGDVACNEILSQTNIYDYIIHPTKLNRTTKLLKPLRILLNEISDVTDILKQIKPIIKFLEPYVLKNCKLKDKYSYDEKMDDLKTLQLYIGKSDSIHQFLEDIHLNIDVEDKMKEDADEDYLLLSTIHGSKGLEWDCVYLAGASSDLIPSYRPELYTDELNNIEEERRLFYVGCSRAKKSLEITLSYDYHFVNNTTICASPFIKEINPSLYDGVNLTCPERIYKGNVTSIVTNYLLIKSNSNVYPYLKTLPNKYTSFYLNSSIDNVFFKNKCEKVYGTFIDNLLTKMIYQKYSDDIDDFDIPIYQKYNCRKDTHYYKYLDAKADWRDNIQSIMEISVKKAYCRVKKEHLLEWVKNKAEMLLYNRMEKAILHIVKECLDNAKGKDKSPKDDINLHMNVSYGDIFGETDLVIGRTLIEFKTSKDCIGTTRNVLQTIMYRYMLRKKGIRIDNIILFNPLLGEMYTLEITPHWKYTFKVFNELLNIN